MSFNLTIPQHDGTKQDISIDTGQCLFVLGANGTGKSTLMHHFYRECPATARRITAHRQNWLSTNALTLSPEARINLDTNLRNTDSGPTARWRESHAEERVSIALYDLIDNENEIARRIAKAVYDNDLELAQNHAKQAAPINIINELLRQSNIHIKISVGIDGRVYASKSPDSPYSIAELSDGERNAILIAANVLTVRNGTLILIDEPERHLHRSIISPLLKSLFAQRPDCAFIISTHEVMLPLDVPESQILLIRGCDFKNSENITWESDVLSSESDIDDDIKRDILGARRKLLFIEGTENSLDKSLYSIIFPNVSVIAKSSSRDVEHTVSSIRDSESLHWLQAFGIIDNDGRSQEDINRLKSKGIYALPVFSVESIYYYTELQGRVAARQAEVTGDNVGRRIHEATLSAIEVIRPHAQRLSERAVEKKLREEMFKHLPKREEIAAANPINVTIDVPSIVREENNCFQAALNEGNLSDIIAHYPVRETPALKTIATKLGFQNREQYEAAVRKLLKDDANSKELVRNLFDTLITDINES